MAGVSTDGVVRRLFPIPDRLLNRELRFRKYDTIRVIMNKASNDVRPESHHVNLERSSFEKLGNVSTGKRKDWAERDILVEPFRAQSIESLKVIDIRQDRSLALIRPKEIVKFSISATGDTDWDEDQRRKLQGKGPIEGDEFMPVEYVPFDFKYQFVCDDPDCPGHTFRVLDWEAYEAYRQWKMKYGDGWREKFTYRFDEWMRGRDLQFYVGTIHGHPMNWTIIGLYYPPMPT